MNRFQENEDVKVAILSIRAAGVGLTLTVCARGGGGHGAGILGWCVPLWGMAPLDFEQRGTYVQSMVLVGKREEAHSARVPGDELVGPCPVVLPQPMSL